MEYLFHILVITGIYIILTLSLNLLVGYTGLPALGHAAFFGMGAYASALLALKLGLSPWFSLLIGASLAALLGCAIAIPSIRFKGDYFALVTFGFGIIVYSIANNWVSVTGGPMGIPGIPGFSFFGFILPEIWFYLILVTFFIFLTYFTMKRIVNSPFGRILQAIREDEIATLSIGKDVDRHKILVFSMGSFFAGIAGSLYAHYITYINPSSFTLMESIIILLMVAFGGMGNLAGSFVGASALVIFPEALRFLGIPSFVAAPMRQMIYGLLLIVLMIKRPQGILGKYKFR
jgi:branched-chain amino acid transport system permease protein